MVVKNKNTDHEIVEQFVLDRRVWEVQGDEDDTAEGFWRQLVDMVMLLRVEKLQEPS